jgi:hypothetical protein
MATSPLFGWEEPDDTDLVKDGAAAIRTLGNAIDTSMGDLLGGTTGQVLSKASNTNMDFTWVTSDDANAIQNTIVDAKGDLISATGSDVPARLAVGANNTFLRANSAAATGLEYAGAYTTFTPAFFNLTLGNGTASGRYLRIGNFVHATVKVAFGSTTSISGGVFIDFPVSANTAANNNNIGNVRFNDSGTAAYFGSIIQNSGSNFAVFVQTANGTYSSESGLSATIPFTWTTNDEIYISISYEAA